MLIFVVKVPHCMCLSTFGSMSVSNPFGVTVALVLTSGLSYRKIVSRATPIFLT